MHDEVGKLRSLNNLRTIQLYSVYIAEVKRREEPRDKASKDMVQLLMLIRGSLLTHSCHLLLHLHTADIGSRWRHTAYTSPPHQEEHLRTIYQKNTVNWKTFPLPSHIHMYCIKKQVHN